MGLPSLHKHCCPFLKDTALQYKAVDVNDSECALNHPKS